MTRSTIQKAAIALPLATLALAVSSAFAAPVVGASDNSFYTVPSPLPDGANGDLISYRTATANLGTGAPAFKAWNVMYRSTNARAGANAVTGTVFVPTARWSGSGPRPIVTYAVGTHGLAQNCAPSFQFAAGTDYENANIVAALKAGYTVVVTDYAGYTNGDTPTYLAGASQGHAALDIVRAAAQIPNAGISASAKVAVWGYSQGGQTAGWAGELKDTYAPELNVVGIAAGGVPGDFITTARYLDARNGAGFLLSATIGLAQEYPDKIPFDALANEAGLEAAAQGKQICVFEALFKFMNHGIVEYTGLPLDSLISLLTIKSALNAQTLGKTKISAPVYQYHGQTDWAIPLGQAYDLKKKYCALGTNVRFDLYPGAEHIIAQFQAAPTVLSWLGDRFNGKTAVGTCSTTQADPVSTANPNDGNFIVSLRSWPLVASMGLKTLGQTVKLPTTSTFTADTDLTSKQLKNGVLSVPDFTAKLSLLWIIPIDVKLSVTPVGSASGSATLDNAGKLHVHGSQSANLKIQTVGSLGINIPTGCSTSSPVVFPLDFDGPVSALGNGQLTFAGTTSFPSLSGCGLYGPLLSTLMSGPGQTYSFTVVPPAPVKN
ncbi:MAG: Triacylglycerol lipase [Aquabacterium sp.]|nr:MAG: Triacylglycerol lipase [Aquabacterium sp.]